MAFWRKLLGGSKRPSEKELALEYIERSSKWSAKLAPATPLTQEAKQGLIERIIDETSAEMMAKYGLSRDEMLKIVLLSAEHDSGRQSGILTRQSSDDEIRARVEPMVDEKIQRQLDEYRKARLEESEQALRAEAARIAGKNADAFLRAEGGALRKPLLEEVEKLVTTKRRELQATRKQLLDEAVRRFRASL